MTDIGSDLIADHVFYPHIQRANPETSGSIQQYCFTCRLPEERHLRVAVHSVSYASTVQNIKVAR